MSSSSRRFEILLPLRFNDGQPVPDDLVADTLLELRQQFGAVSSETQVIRGIWEHQGQSYRDDLVRVFVDVADVPESRHFFIDFKERLKSRFQQLDIWVTTYPIEVL
jgi:homoserine trans-succinylase